MRNHGRVGAWALLWAWALVWPAQAQVTIPDEYGKHIQQRSQIAAGGVQFGERVDPNTGDLEIVQTDVELSGNGPAVRVGRRYRPRDAYGKGHFNYWDMDIPHLHGTFADIVSPLNGWTGWGSDPKQRCSKFSEPRLISHQGGYFDPNEYWSGSYFYLPGSGEQELLERSNAHVPNDGAAYPVVTKEGAAVRCVTLAATSEGGSGEGEGFEVVTPDGMVYTLNQMVSRYEKPLRKPDPFPPFAAASPKAPANGQVTSAGGQLLPPDYILPRREVLLFPTQVKDRFGNTATYVWSTTNPWQLLWIEASDGRRLDFTYESPTSNRVTAVSDGSRTWQYTYFPGFGQTDDPDTVILPDGSQWISRLRRLSLATTPTYNVTCDNLNISTAPDTGSITSPSGATLLLTMASVKFGRSWVSRECIQNGDGTERAVEPNLFVGYAVTSKKITGAGLPPAGLTWTYAYGTPNQCWDPFGVSSGACTPTSPTTRTTSVTDPDGNVIRYSFGNRFRVNEGLLLKTEYGWNGTSALRAETIAYADPQSGPYASYNGNSRRNVGDFDITSFKRPQQQIATVQQGVTFTWQANGFDSFARPLSVTRSSTLGYSRTDLTAYHDNANKWVLGQVASSTNSDTGLVESQTDYWPTTALPQRTYSFGKPQQYFVYNADGTLASMTDGNNHATSFGSWKRGIPQSITFADNTTKSAQVNDLGQIDWVKGETGAKTCYGYDAMGRVNSIAHPSEDPNKPGICNQDNWLATTIAFAPSAEAKYGLPANHWRRTEATGNARKITFYDALWRPMVQETYDLADTGNTLSQSVTRYDANGQVVYASYPQRNMLPSVYNTWADPAQIPNALGTWTSYDTLGRPTQVQQNSELGLLSTTIEYLSGFMTRTTNPRGIATVAQYQAYDQPSTDALSGITVFSGVDTAATEIVRDIFGKPQQIKRRNENGTLSSTRYYGYNAYQELCRTIEPETGTTLMGYDPAGNLKWSAAGLMDGLPPCETDGTTPAVAAQRVDRTYDVRNRLKTLAFPGGNGNQNWEYTSDGLPSRITTANDAGTSSVVNEYDYNRRRLPTAERQTQLGMPTWSLGYGYDGYGSLASHTYPNGLTVAYAPNALGQPTQAGTYASGVSYWPNGAVKQFTYGNGIVHTMTQNARQLPDQSVDSGGVLNDSYDYDPNGNVLAISDGLAGARGNRDMTYDGLDRLKTAVSPMFAGTASYDYDALDNLTRVVAPGRDHYYCYDPNRWQLTNVKTGSCAGTTVVGLGYDAQGNLANKNGVLYVFDTGNRLREVVGKESYRYDGYGRRVSATAGQGSIYSIYGQDGALRYQRDERKAEAYDYIHLNGSLLARETDQTVVVGVPVVTTPASSDTGSYTAAWTAVTLATRYEAEEALNGGAWQALYTGTATSVARNGLTTGNYGYRVRACRDSSCGNWSATATTAVNVPPAGAPTVSAPAQAAHGNYSVTWTSVGGATSYTLEESVNGGAWTQSYSGAGISQSYSGRPAGSYGYRARACNPIGCGGYSGTATVQSIHLPGVPTISVPAASYTGSYTVSWPAVSGADSYKLEERVGTGAWAEIQNSAALSKAFAGKADDSYSYRARACNFAGCSDYSLAPGIQVTTPPTSAPTLSTPANNYTGSYTVSWTGVSKATSYTLHMSVNGAAGTNIYSGPAGSYAVSGQSVATYTYYVMACNVAGCSNWSAPASTQVVSVPEMPSSLTGEKIELSDLDRLYSVYWSSVPGATSYELQRSTGGAYTATYTGSANHYDFETRAASLNFRVRACNPAGCSAWKSGLTL